MQSAAIKMAGSGPKRGKYSSRRLRSEGAILLTVCLNKDQISAVRNLACSIAKIQKTTLVVAVPDAALQAQLENTKGMIIVYHSAFASSMHGEYSSSWLITSVLYLVNALGFDAFFLQPNAIWRRDVLTPILESGRFRYADAIFATIEDGTNTLPPPFAALPAAFFLRCNWKTELFLDALLHSQDLAESWGFAATINQHLSETHSLFGLEVQRFNPCNQIHILDNEYHRSLSNKNIMRVKKKRKSGGPIGASLRKFNKEELVTTKEASDHPTDTIPTALEGVYDYADIYIPRNIDSPPPIWLDQCGIS